ncbi:aminotransferase class I/II-fold pyridoxal phosphate-dependent enzyme [Paraburkholderia madseniana]|uniref:Aminotransferase n=1 Tax=Paraburkholderia madseniana TaxID=2599607 RepID=A0A6N6W2W2_9BURK|nr:pyridoxal phosphate-dependent aminotransferase [Paraburkholderia madseniana]KAE8754952.1 aminotransferase class I/II-fold pyridoxal phosphate-dependent enzyme [Paraburkholderia madseniana]
MNTLESKSNFQDIFPIQPRDTVSSLPTSLIREVADGAMNRSDILPFWFGESDQVTPDFIRDAAIESLRSGETFYPQNLGRPYLRSALSLYLTQLHGCTIDSDRLAVVSGGISGLMLTAQTIIEPGDRVVAITPLWPNIAEIPRILGANVTRVPLSVVNGAWALDVNKLISELTAGTKVLFINSPNNPTGWMMTERDVDEILVHCRKHGIWIVSDDVYQRLAYDQAVFCAPSFLDRYQDGDRIISVNSFSKSWLMTGFRVGWVVAPPSIVKALTKIIEYNTCCILEASQRAAHSALLRGEDTVQSLRADLRSNRKVLVDGLCELPGVEVPGAGGGMYTFFKIAGISDTTALARNLIDVSGLGLAPGAAFGPEGRGWLRWCHAVSGVKLSEGLSRITRFFEHNRIV